MTRPSPQLCIALDGSDRHWIVRTARDLAAEAGWLKIGLEAFTAHGPELVREVVDVGAPVFLDVKLHDIPATVRRAAANAASCGVRMVTVHAAGGSSMVAAAIEGAQTAAAAERPLVVAVTLLTSLDQTALAQLGVAGSAAEAVERWTRLSLAAGADGVVASAREAADLRRTFGDGCLLVTPGIRPSGADRNDQRRTATPAEAVRAGSDILVVGRPITGADDPAGAARSIRAEIDATWSEARG